MSAPRPTPVNRNELGEGPGLTLTGPTGKVVAGSEIAESAQALLERLEVAYLLLRSATNNCYQCRIERS